MTHTAWAGTAIPASLDPSSFEGAVLQAINDLAKRVEALETRKTVTVVPQRGGTIVYEHRVIEDGA